MTLWIIFDTLWSIIHLGLTLCDHMDYSLPGPSVCEIFQAKTLEWGQSHSRGSSPPRDQEFNPHLLCFLRWQVDSFSLNHVGNPFDSTIFYFLNCLQLTCTPFLIRKQFHLLFHQNSLVDNVLEQKVKTFCPLYPRCHFKCLALLLTFCASQ